MPVMATAASAKKITLIAALVSSVIVFILIKFKVNLFYAAVSLGLLSIFKSSAQKGGFLFKVM